MCCTSSCRGYTVVYWRNGSADVPQDGFCSQYGTYSDRSDSTGPYVSSCGCTGYLEKMREKPMICQLYNSFSLKLSQLLMCYMDTSSQCTMLSQQTSLSHLSSACNNNNTNRKKKQASVEQQLSNCLTCFIDDHQLCIFKTNYYTLSLAKDILVFNNLFGKSFRNSKNYI